MAIPPGYSAEIMGERLGLFLATTAPAASGPAIEPVRGAIAMFTLITLVLGAFLVIVVAMVVADKVGIASDKLNVNGGAVALGHPIGMTGARLILTSLYELRRRGGKYAVCTPCIGGGEATAVLLEAL